MANEVTALIPEERNIPFLKMIFQSTKHLKWLILMLFHDMHQLQLYTKNEMRFPPWWSSASWIFQWERFILFQISPFATYPINLTVFHQIWWGLQFMKLLFIQSVPFSCLKSKYFHQEPGILL
jgi:hypothetical protein